MSHPTAPDSLVSTEETMREVNARICERYADHSLGDDVRPVKALMRRACDLADEGEPLLIETLIDDGDDFHLETQLLFSTHRRLLGGPIVWIKRRLLLPVTRWLFEYCQRNFLRQRRVNRALLALVEVAFAENVRLRRDLERLSREDGSIGNGST